MSAARRRSLSSRIFRRVQAHARVAVLFRASVQPGATRLPQPAAAERVAEEVSAFPLPPEASLPLGQVVGGPPLEMPLPPAAPLLFPAAVEARQLPTSPKPARLEPPPVSAPAVPAAEERGLDADWPRLQNILQRHREAEAAGNEPITPPPEHARPPGKPRKIPQPSRLAEIEKAKSTPVETRAVQAQPGETPLAAAPSGQPMPLKPRRGERARKAAPIQREDSQTQAAPPRAKTPPPPAAAQETIEAPQPTKGRPAEVVPSLEERQAAEPIRREPVPPRREEIETPAPVHEQPARSKPAAEKRPVEETPVSRTPESPPVQPVETPEPAAEPLEEQPLPLQAAWPVIQREPAEVKPLQSHEIPAEEIPPLPAGLPPAESKRLKQIEQILEKVEAGQPTDSQVEIITPRRPRPTAPPKPVQREPEQVEESIIKKEKKGEPPAKKAKAKAAPAPEMIATEIGPLPSDLWGLIGQPITQPKAETAPPGPIKPSAPEIEESALPAAYLWPEEEAEEAEEPAEVQMQAERAAAAAETASAPAKTGGETNIDDLARQVYREIKKRLTIELERFRRKK